MESIIHSTNLDEIISYLKEKGILRSEAPYCLKCDKKFEWRKRGGSNDVYNWKCTKCDATSSIRKDSFLEEFKIPILKIVKLIHAYAFEYKIEDTCSNLELSKPTVIKFFKRMRECICIEVGLENMKVGGLGEVVEIDESKFMKVKHGKGKDLKRKLVILLFI